MEKEELERADYCLQLGYQAYIAGIVLNIMVSSLKEANIIEDIKGVENG